MGSLLLDVGGRDDLSGKMEPFTEVVETLWGESVVVVLPGELSLDIAAGGERLAGLDDVEVLGVNVVVLGEVVVLLCDEDTLSEEVLVDLLAVCLWNKPGRTLAYWVAVDYNQYISHLGGCRTFVGVVKGRCVVRKKVRADFYFAVCVRSLEFLRYCEPLWLRDQLLAQSSLLELD